MIRGVISLEGSSLVVFCCLIASENAMRQQNTTMRQQNTTKLLPSRETTPLIRPDFRCTEIVKYY
jgi:hypothetical protein